MTSFADPTLEQTAERMEGAEVSGLLSRRAEILEAFKDGDYPMDKDEFLDLYAELAGIDVKLQVDGCDTGMAAQMDEAGFGHSGQL